jgi:nicotinamide-nucleotide amidase
LNCEVVAVGTELLLGQVVDTNSSWIGEQLALAGIDSHHQIKVGDNFARIEGTLRQALDRSDAVIVCGGLGPTQDDITRDVIAAVMGVDLVSDPDLVERIRSMFGTRGRHMPDNNLRQAQVPRGAAAIPIMPGTAPGLVGEMGDKVIYAVPGVPWEMQEMVGGFVIDDLKQRAGITSVIKSRVLRTWGQSESGLAEILHEEIERLDAGPGVTIAFLASGIEGLKVRLTAKAETEAAVDVLLGEEEVIVRGLIGDIIFGVDDETMESSVLDLCRTQGLTLGIAESLTGGMIGSRLTDVAGASDVFKGSLVTYANEVKRSLLGIPDGPVVSEEAVVGMAEGACRVLSADCSLAVTGVAGPDPQDGQDPGTVWMATSVDGIVEASQVKYPFDRERTRQFTTITVLSLLRQRLVIRG